MADEKPTHIPLHIWACVDKRFKYHGIDNCGGYFYTKQPKLNPPGSYWITDGDMAADKCLAGIVHGSRKILVERPVPGVKHASSTTLDQ